VGAAESGAFKASGSDASANNSISKMRTFRRVKSRRDRYSRRWTMMTSCSDVTLSCSASVLYCNGKMPHASRLLRRGIEVNRITRKAICFPRYSVNFDATSCFTHRNFLHSYTFWRAGTSVHVYVMALYAVAYQWLACNSSSRDSLECLLAKL